MSWNALVINIAVKSHWYSTGINQFSWGPALRCHSRKWPREGSRDAHFEHGYFDLCQRDPAVFTRSDNDRHILHFPPTTWMNNGFNVVFNRPLPFFRQLHYSVFPKYCYLLEQGTLPGAFCSLPGNGNLSPLREIQKDWTKQPRKVVMSAEYCAQITTGSQAGNTLAWSPKGNKNSHLIHKLPCLLLTNCGLSLEWCFQLV